MAQDATWQGGQGGRPRLRRRCVRWGPAQPHGKWRSRSPFFGPCLLWPNGCMDHDATWYAGKPRPRSQCFRWGPSFLYGKGHSSPHISAHVYTVAKRSPISASTAELLLSHLQKDAALWRIGTIMVGGVIAHPFAKMLWIGLMPDVDPHSLENMHCLMPTPTARRV